MSDNKTKVMPLNRYFKSNNNNQPCNITLKNAYLGMKAPTTHPLLLVLPISSRDRMIFEQKKNKKHSNMIDEKEEKNELTFAKNHSKAKNVLNEKQKQEELEEMFTNISRENYYVVFLKV